VAKQPVDIRRQRPARKNMIDWFQSADESVESIADWDLKPGHLESAVLGVLSVGDAIMFGVSMAGDAISVTIYSGERKSRKWVSDAIEFEQLLGVIASRAQTTHPTDKRGESAAD
jgi:hypothetical protein